jgi:hypothetical protein
MGGRCWVRQSLRTIKRELKALGRGLSHVTVGRLLKKLGFSLLKNRKLVSATPRHPQREAQFKWIECQRRRFYELGHPVISVDTKKKELIGNFAQAGQKWGQAAEKVLDHDFGGDGVGRAVPYGIYDLRTQRGSVYVGDSADTAEFAVAAIVKWWEEEGQWVYNGAKELLILADSGGSNGCRVRMWKYQLQTRLSNRFGLSVVVCHYPPGCSKYNPIEHKLFTQISRNWAGQPLRSFELAVGYIAGTTTEKGLQVRAKLLRGSYAKGQTVSEAEMQALNLEQAEVCPQWNYTLRPQSLRQESSFLALTGS